MTISDDEDFNHLANEIFGEGTSPIHLYCIHNKIKLHVSWRQNSKLVTGDDEYIDPGTGASATLSEDDIFEIHAIPSFKAFMQNETGPKKTFPLDITELSSNDFTRYLTDDYDEDNPDKYDINLACMFINFYTSDYQDRAHAHVLNVLLDAAVNNETTLALEENNVYHHYQPYWNIYVHRGWFLD